MRVEYFASRRSIEKSINEEAKINDTRQWQKHKTRVKKFHLQFTDARSKEKQSQNTLLKQIEKLRCVNWHKRNRLVKLSVGDHLENDGPCKVQWKLFLAFKVVCQGQGRLSWVQSTRARSLRDKWACARGSATISRCSLWTIAIVVRGRAEWKWQEQGRSRYKIENFSKTARRRRGKTRYASIAEWKPLIR